MRSSLARLFCWLILMTMSLGMLSGCLGNRNWQYPPSSTDAYLDVKAQKALPAKAVVLPFEDLRGKDMKEEYWKAAIPLVRYGSTKYDRPEEAANPEQVDVVNFDPSNDFASATAAELQEAGIFSSVAFAKNGETSGADLVFRGKLRSTEWERQIDTYYLGPLGVIFWFLGIPMGETETAVELDLKLTPASDPSRVLWSMAMEYEGEKHDSPYYNLEDAVQSYPGALQEALRPAILDLVQLADEDPERLAP
ncbi:MAG: hypothetical protein MRJ96_07395 [Nitrospirales bacterium]|nr:hypothetical protein [Nitrospira sp.]MDR4501256.1 hypothetical protein [Nitrospirales bacterium]